MKKYRVMVRSSLVIGYSLMFDGSGSHVERSCSLLGTPIELVLKAEDLRDFSVFEVSEPFSGVGVEIVAVKILEGFSEARAEDLEKALVLADELGADYVVVPVGEGDLRVAADSLDRIFESAAAYAKKVALEPSRGVQLELSGYVSKFLGGVFKYVLSPAPGLTTDEMIAFAVEHLGQLAAVKLVCFTRDGRAARVTRASGINVFALMRELEERGYDGLYVLDYEPRGLLLPLQLVRGDLDLLLQYLRSLAEKS